MKLALAQWLLFALPLSSILYSGAALSQDITSLIGQRTLEVRDFVRDRWNCTSRDGTYAISCQISNYAQVNFRSINATIEEIEVRYSRIGFERQGTQMIYGAGASSRNTTEFDRDSEMYEQFRRIRALPENFEYSFGNVTKIFPLMSSREVSDFLRMHECTFPLGIGSDIADCVSFAEINNGTLTIHSMARIRRQYFPGYSANLAGHSLFISLDTGVPSLLENASQERNERLQRLDAESQERERRERENNATLRFLIPGSD